MIIKFKGEELMQKWRKVLLVSLFIMAIIDGLIGFAMAKSGIGKVKVFANIDMFSLIMLILLIFIVVCMTLDIHGIFKSKNQFGPAKFKVMIKTRKRLRNVLIFLVLDTICEFGIFLYSTDMHMLPLCFIILLFTLIQIFHYKVDNGIGENGILHWGVYHSWTDVKSYKIDNEPSLEINILSKSFGFKYKNKIKFDFDKKDKDNIERFLAERL